MRIVADQAIPYIRHFFSDLGELILVEGRAMNPALVREADLLVVRTVTRIDAQLLEGSRVRFVASATSGVDHVDLEYLAARGITFADARGCNARAVAEYVLSSLFVLADNRGLGLAGKCAGIIGCGHAGGAVMHYLKALGLKCLAHDPPLKLATSDLDLVGLPDLYGVDILTLHVPLTVGGAYPTRHLVDHGLLSRLRDDVVIINTARGEVVNEDALCGFLDAHPDASAIIDVWSGEPRISAALLVRVAIGTPHIAGYSADARLRATESVGRRAREFLGQDANAVRSPDLPVPGVAEIAIAPGAGALEAVQMAVLASYDVRSDAAPLRRTAGLAPEGRAACFAELRNHYPLRREFSTHTVRLPARTGPLAEMLARVGFTVETDGRSTNP